MGLAEIFGLFILLALIILLSIGLFVLFFLYLLIIVIIGNHKRHIPKNLLQRQNNSTEKIGGLLRSHSSSFAFLKKDYKGRCYCRFCIGLLYLFLSYDYRESFNIGSTSD